MSEHDKHKVNGTQTHKKRTPLHQQQPLMVQEKPGYKLYVMNNKRGEREKFERAGWTACTDKSLNQSDVHVKNGAQAGSELIINVNQDPMAACHTATVMEIPEALYNEDFMDAMLQIDKSEEALDPSKNRINGSSYGVLKKEFE